MGFTRSFLRLGATIIVMEQFDTVESLKLIEKYQVTHSQWVPTMFVRMLKLPEDVRSPFDVSSLQVCIHAAAPCPVPVKEAMIQWWGPVIHEYYAGTEGNGFCAINSEEWLAHKGSVGRPLNATLHILDDQFEELPARKEGSIYFESAVKFEYHNAPEKTADGRSPQGARCGSRPQRHRTGCRGSRRRAFLRGRCARSRRRCRSCACRRKWRAARDLAPTGRSPT